MTVVVNRKTSNSLNTLFQLCLHDVFEPGIADGVMCNDFAIINHAKTAKSTRRTLHQFGLIEFNQLNLLQNY